eukprot:403341540
MRHTANTTNYNRMRNTRTTTEFNTNTSTSSSTTSSGSTTTSNGGGDQSPEGKAHGRMPGNFKHTNSKRQCQPKQQSGGWINQQQLSSTCIHQAEGSIGSQQSGKNNNNKAQTASSNRCLYRMNQFNNHTLLTGNSTIFTQVGQACPINMLECDQQQGTGINTLIQNEDKQNLESHLLWKSQIINCLSERWNNSFCVNAQNQKIAVENYLGDVNDTVSTSQGIKHFLHYDAAMIKSKVNRIPAIAKKLEITEDLVQERLSFMVLMTETLDRLIFEDGATPTDITIGGEGGYRIKVDNNMQLDEKLKELEGTTGMTPWGVSKSYKVEGLTVHTFIDMRFKVERYSTIF